VVYALNGGTLFALGGYSNYSLTNTSSLTPAVVGQSITYTTTVASTTGGAVPTGTITYSYTSGVNDPLNSTPVTLGTASLVNGQATFTTSALLPDHYHLTASYSGDTTDGYAAGSTTLVQVVLETTTTSVSASASQVAAGQGVTFTATVTPTGTSFVPIGTVTFMDGSTVLGTAALNALDQATYTSTNQATFSTSSLPVGIDAITAVYNGDLNFAGSTSSPLDESVGGTTTQVVSSANPSVYGQIVTFTATVAPVVGTNTPGGTVSFDDGTNMLGTATLSGGSATFSTSALSLGGHSITVSYSGDSSDAASTSNTLSQTVNQDATSTGLSSSQNPSVYGQSVTFTATVTAASPGSGTPSGIVTFMDGTTTLGTGSLSGGIATYSTSSLALNGHSITASYGGDSNYTSSSTTSPLTQTVNQDGATTSLSSSIDPSAKGQSVTFTATVSAASPGSGTPTGAVTFLDGTTILGTRTLSGGSAIFTTTTLTAGTHSITVTYGGDTNFTSSPPSNTVVQTVGGTTTSLASSSNPSVYGAKVTFTATVAALIGGSGTPTGTVTFFDGTTKLGSGAVNGTTGQATYTTTAFGLAFGDNVITATYGGSTNFAASTSSALTQTVEQDSSTTVVTSSADPSVFGQKVILTVAVTATAPGSGIATGTVTFYDGTTVLGTGTLNTGGKATLTTTAFALGLGGNSITASYSGDSHFTGGTSGVLTQTVNQDPTTSKIVTSAATAVVGQSVTFTATITSNSPGSGTPTGSVAFLDGTTVLGTATLSAGKATFTTSDLALGGHSISVSYGGDTNYATSNSTAFTETINQAGTKTVVTSSASPAVIGQTITFTTTVTAKAPGSGVPTGSVTFMDGTAVLGTGTLNGSGQATLAVSSLAFGTHSITVVYGGDTNYITSTSSALPQRVNMAATTTTVQSSNPSSMFGQLVTFTATVAANSPGSGIPTGTVTFYDGTTVLGTQTLSGGTATFSTSSLKVGTHSIKVKYNGDPNYIASTSAILTQTVS
jgi:hypothetical protein